MSRSSSDRDLAALYGLATKVLNQIVKRHSARFPEDFAFKPTPGEWRQLRELLPPRRGRGGLGYRPRVFTEQGVMMIASLLRGRRAVALSLEIIRAFAKNRIDQPRSFLEDLQQHLPTLDRVVAAALDQSGDADELVTYFLQAGINGPIKIGVTASFEKRYRGLEMSSPVPLRLLGIVPRDIEAHCHTALHAYRLHGEWFRPTQEVVSFIRDLQPLTPGLN